jgi:hypothetical protein
MRDPPRKALAAWALRLGLCCIGAAAPQLAAAQASNSLEAAVSASATAAAPPPAAGAVQLAGPAPVSDAVAQFAGWVAASGDNRSMTFVVIDKTAAQVAVFGADGALKGATPALLGLAHGDDSVPGIGERKISSIRPDERTTPAGRFLAQFGPSLGGKKVLWVDYATAISLHPVVTANAKEQRLQRLKTPSPIDNRITYGCINVPAGFYEKVVRPAFTGAQGIVYILPESRALAEVFPAFQPEAKSATALLDEEVRPTAEDASAKSGS